MKLLGSNRTKYSWFTYSRCQCVVTLPASNWPKGVTLTPFHSVRIDGNWTWPRLLNATTTRFCDAVYNVVVDYGCSITAAGVEMVTLGHEQVGDYVGHHIYGSRSRVEEIARSSQMCEDRLILVK